jgi:hypothetical protein
MSMTVKQEKDHLKFLVTRLQFMKMQGNFAPTYDRARDILYNLWLDVIDLEKEMEEDVNSY